MTLKDAILQGYQFADIKASAGYISRRTPLLCDRLFEELKFAPRRKQFYIEIPRHDTTRYHFRLYLEKKD